MSSIVTQLNWRFYADDASEPLTALAAENATPTIVDNNDIVRLRYTIKIENLASFLFPEIQYSINNINWNDFGASNEWDYADGQANNGDTTTTFKLSDSDTHGEYYENTGSLVLFNVASTESDVAIRPTVNIKLGTLYYFRIIGARILGLPIEIQLGIGETHPRVITSGEAGGDGGGGIGSTLKEQNYRFYANDAPEPSTALAGENLPPTLANNTDIIRLRTTIAETGGVDDNGTISVEYSTDGFTFTNFGSLNQWNFANGQAVNGDATTTFKLTDSNTHGKYLEDNVTPQPITANSRTEIDITLFPTATVYPSTAYSFRLRIAGNIIPLQSGSTYPQVITAAKTSFIPKQGNFKIFQDDGAEPTTALANENVQATLQNNTNKIRCRLTVAETGGLAGSGAVSMEYSTDNKIFTALGSLNAAWNYTDGVATNGNQVTTNKLTDTSNRMHYHEDAIGSESWVALTGYEMDFAIVPTVFVAVSKVYYFRVKIGGNVVALNTGKTHPSVLTLAAPAPSGPSSPGTPYDILNYDAISVSIVGDSEGNIYQLDSGDNNGDEAISGYIETGDMVLGDAQFDKRIYEIIPMLDTHDLNKTLMVQVGSRQSLGQDINWSLPVPFNIGIDVKADIRKSGKYIRLRFYTNQLNMPFSILGYKINYSMGSSR